MKYVNVPLLVGIILGAGLLQVLHQTYGQPVEPRVINVEVKDFPHDMSIGFHNPLTGTLAAMKCSTSITEDYDMDLSVFSEMRVQAYGCKRIDPHTL